MTRRTSSSLYIYRGRRTLHVMGHGPGRHMKTRGPSHGKDGRLLVVVSLLHIISWAWPGLACEYIWGPSWAGRSGSRRVHISGASARPGLSIFKMTGRGPARHTNRPAHYISGCWAATRPGQSITPNSRAGSVRPGPAGTTGL